MAIEFRCDQCGKLLRVADETAGKQAKCPSCGAIQPIPSTGPGGERPSSAASGNPFDALSPAGPVETGNPYQAPAGSEARPHAYAPAPTGEWRLTQIDAGDVLGRAWEIYKRDMGTVIGGVIVSGILQQIVTQITSITLAVVFQPRDGSAEAVALGMFAGMLSLLVNAWFAAGLALMLLRVARGERASIGDIFAGGPYYVATLVATIIFTMITLVGYMLCVVPGVILALMFSQFGYVIVDRNVSFGEALEKSREITQGNKLTLFVLGLASFGILLAGLLACFVGLIFAAPYVALLFAVAYVSMTGQRTALDEAP